MNLDGSLHGVSGLWPDALAGRRKEGIARYPVMLCCASSIISLCFLMYLDLHFLRPHYVCSPAQHCQEEYLRGKGSFSAFHSFFRAFYTQLSSTSI